VKKYAANVLPAVSNHCNELYRLQAVTYLAFVHMLVLLGQPYAGLATSCSFTFCFTWFYVASYKFTVSV